MRIISKSDNNSDTVVELNRTARTGRYLSIRKRDYSHTDVIHPRHGYLCRLLSMPTGFKVTQAASKARHMTGRHFQSPQIFERAYLRGAT